MSGEAVQQTRGPRQEQQPGDGLVVEVAPGILRAQLDISMPGLGHVNCYVIPDGSGCTVVDPGMPGVDNYGIVTGKLKEAGFDVGHVHTLVVTHSHPDHFGAVGRMAAESGARVVTHASFRLWWAEDPDDPCAGADVEVDDLHPEDIPTTNPWEGGTPWGGPGPERPRTLSILDPVDFRPPRPTHRLKDGDRITLGDRSFLAIHTPGHTLDHLCLLDEENGTFLSGDHVLPTITPHISGIGAGPDPLARFYDSLDKVAALGVKKTLPAHGLTFDDLGGRTEAIKRHHHERLDKVRNIGLALGPSTVEAYSHELFLPRSWGPMADSETYAHLEHLRRQGQAESHVGADGQTIFEVVS